MLRFAPRYGMISPCLRRPAGQPAQAANDNASCRTQRRDPLPGKGMSHAPSTTGSPARAMAARVADTLSHDALLAQALRLFASHGHAAAGQAATAAMGAAVAGDHHGAAWWARVCHTLDRRQAHALERELSLLA